MVRYNDLLHEHFHNPRHYGRMHEPDFHVVRKNAACGDVVEIYGSIDKDKQKLDKVLFEERGCMVATAAVSIVCEALCGTSIAGITLIDQQAVKELLGSIELGPTRMRCAMLAVDAIKEGVRRYA